MVVRKFYDTMAEPNGGSIEYVNPNKKELEITDFVYAANTVKFIRYKKGFFYFEVSRKNTEDTYEFYAPQDEIGDIMILRDDKSIHYMRWIRKSIEEGSLIKVN